MGLGVLDRARYVEVLVERLESSVDKLPTIVSDDGVRDSEPTHNASSHEVYNIFGRDGGKWLDLNLLGEVIDSN